MNSLHWLPAELPVLAALALVATSFLTSAVSAAFGLGGGVAMLIALLSLTPPVVALPVHALVQIGSNSGRAWMLRSHIMPDVLRWFVPGSLLGVLLASQLLVSVPARWLQLVLGMFILWSVWAPRISAVAVPDRAYLAVGGVTSFATMFLGATGPLLAAFLSPSRYGRDRMVSTHAACMSVQHLIKVIAFGFLGFVLTEWLPLVLVMILSGLAGTWLGRSLLRRLPEERFRLIFKTILSLLAVRLLFKSIGI